MIVAAATVTSCRGRSQNSIVEDVREQPLPSAIYHSPIGPHEIRFSLSQPIGGLYYVLYDPNGKVLDQASTLSNSNPNLNGQVHLGQGGGEFSIPTPSNMNSVILAIRTPHSLTKVFKVSNLTAGQDLGVVNLVLGDMDGDDQITSSDISIVRHFMGHDTDSISSRELRLGSITCDDADFDNDGKVSQADLDLVMSNAGKEGDCFRSSLPFTIFTR